MIVSAVHEMLIQSFIRPVTGMHEIKWKCPNCKKTVNNDIIKWLVFLSRLILSVRIVKNIINGV